MKDCRPDDNKKRPDVQDFLETFVKLDKEKVMMPLFVAALLVKILGNSLIECDVLVFAASLSDLKSLINEIQHVVASLLSKNKAPIGENKRLSTSTFYPEMKRERLQVDKGQCSSNKLDCAVELSEDYETGSEGVEEIENIGVFFARAAGKNNHKWRAVGKSRQADKSVNNAKAHISVYGSRDRVNRLKAINIVHSRHCKISCVHEDYSTNDVQQYMLELSVVPNKVEMLPRREDAAISMPLVVPYVNKDKVMQPGFWLKGVCISGWYYTSQQRSND